MSQIFDYIACSRATIEKWTEALADGDEDLREEIESGFSGVVSFNNLGQIAVSILAHCSTGRLVDVVKAVATVELVKEIHEQEGPWVMAFRPSVIEAIAAMELDERLLQRWVSAVSDFNGRSDREILSAEAARQLKNLCTIAVQGRLGVFCCFYG